MNTLAMLLKAEFIKLSSTRTALGLLVGAVALSVLPAVLVMALVPREVLEEEDGTGLALLGLSIVPILAVVFGILGMTNEYRHGTITYTYLATPRRGVVIVVKLVCYAVVGAVVMALTGLLVFAAIWLTGTIRGMSYDALFGWLDNEFPLSAVALFLVTVGLMTAFGVGLGALFRAQVPTVAGTLVWALAIEGIIFAVRPRVGQYLPFTALDQLSFTAEMEMATVGLSRPEAFLVSLAYIAGVSLLAVFISMRRDVT